MMTVKLNKISSVITEKSVKSFKTRKELFTFLSGLNYDFEVICDKSIADKTAKKLESFGFGVGQDSDYGFDFEVKLYAFINN